MPKNKSSERSLAVIVGGTGALGKVIVQHLIEAGLDVLAVGRSENELAALAQKYPALSYCLADIGLDAAIDIISNAINRPVRMLVHAPGVRVAGGVLQASTDALNAAINIKVGGMLRLFRAAEKWLGPQSRVVGVGGHYGFEPTAYAATAGVANAALANLMRQLSWALGERGITSHLVAPGPADTERLRAVAHARAEQRGISIEDVLDELKAESAINAFTTPRQVAWAITLLLAPEADALAGSSLMLDSGRRRGLP